MSYEPKLEGRVASRRTGTSRLHSVELAARVLVLGSLFAVSAHVACAKEPCESLAGETTCVSLLGEIEGDFVTLELEFEPRVEVDLSTSSMRKWIRAAVGRKRLKPKALAQFDSLIAHSKRIAVGNEWLRRHYRVIAAEMMETGLAVVRLDGERLLEVHYRDVKSENATARVYSASDGDVVLVMPRLISH